MFYTLNSCRGRKPRYIAGPMNASPINTSPTPSTTAHLLFRRRGSKDASPRLPQPNVPVSSYETDPASKWGRSERVAPKPKTDRHRRDDTAPTPTGVTFKDGIESKALGSFDEFWRVYSKVSTLGRGTFAKVNLVQHRTTRERFAAKIMDKSGDPADTDDMAREFSVLSSLRHKNIIRLYAAYEAPSSFCLVTELATGGELMKRLASSESTVYSEDEVRKHVRTIVEAIHYMHTQASVAHRDLKPENILMSDNSENAQIKIVDLGLSRVFHKQRLMRTVCGTHKYLSPELVQCDRKELLGYGCEVDMWGIGLVAYIMLFGANPFAAPSVKLMHEAIMQCEKVLSFPRGHNVSSEGIAFILDLLRKKANNRLTSAQALGSAWLQYDPLSVSLAEPSETSGELIIEEEGMEAGSGSQRARSVKSRLKQWNAERAIANAVKSVHRRLSGSWIGIAPSPRPPTVV